MSDSIPPFLSSTPPPFEDDGLGNDDFGDFADFTTVTAVPPDPDTSITASSSEFRPVDFVDAWNTDDDVVKPQLFGSESIPTVDIPCSISVEQEVIGPSDAAADDNDSVWSEFAEPSVTIASPSNSSYAEAECTARECGISSGSSIICHELETSSGSKVESSAATAETVSYALSEDISAATDMPDQGMVHNALACENDPMNLSAVHEGLLQLEKKDSYVGTNHSPAHRTDQLGDEGMFSGAVDDSLGGNCECLEFSEVSNIDDERIAAVPFRALHNASSKEDIHSDDFQVEVSESYDWKKDGPLEDAGEDEFSNFESFPVISQNHDSGAPETLFAKEDCSKADLQVIDNSNDSHDSDWSPDCAVHVNEVSVESKAVELDQKSVAPEDCSVPKQQEQTLQDPVDDDFDDFEEFKVATTSVTDEKVQQPLAGDDEWSAFGTSETTDSTSDDWAAFQEPQAIPETVSVPSAVSSSLPSFQSTNSFSGSSQDLLHHSISACFPTNMPELTEHQCEIQNLRKVLGMMTQPGVPGNSMEQHGKNVWNELKVMENTAALKYQWSSSRANDLLLKAINVDTRNMLLARRPGKPSAPAFAMGLGLLEPEKATSDQTKITSNNSFLSSFSSSSKDQGHTGKSGSRLGNILSNNERKSDRDFFDVLERNDGNRPALSNGGIALPKSLDNILASISSSKPSPAGSVPAARKTSANASSEPLSAEAAAVLAHLPDLSFMHAKVLMFPVSDCAN